MCQFAGFTDRLVSYPAEWVSGPCTKLCATLSVVLEGNYTPTVAHMMNHCMTSTMEFTEDQTYMAMGVVDLDRLNFRRNG